MNKQIAANKRTNSSSLQGQFCCHSLRMMCMSEEHYELFISHECQWELDRDM